MSMQDPVADLLTRLRNGHMAKKSSVVVPYSKIKQAILNVLHKEGYIEKYTVNNLNNNKAEILVDLKYYKGKPVISKIVRVSKPGLRVYKTKDKLPKILGGLGISVISTPKGVLSDVEAKQLSQGGEVICLVE
ncbi:MAG: 30S ribosomal protein S8 [Gammaproteobacteria bacterium]